MQSASDRHPLHGDLSRHHHHLPHHPAGPGRLGRGGRLRAPLDGGQQSGCDGEIN